MTGENETIFSAQSRNCVSPIPDCGMDMKESSACITFLNPPNFPPLFPEGSLHF